MRATPRALARALVIAQALTFAAACDRSSDDTGRRFFSIGTAGTGGVYYPLGGVLANRLTAADTGRTFTAEVTGGSVENIKRIASGEMDLGFAIGTSVFEAFNGGQDFPEPVTTLRVVAPLYPNLTHVLVPANSAVTSIAQLRGARISVGAAGSGTEQVSKHLLEAVGLTYNDVDERFLSFTESASALADGAIDAAILSVGYPASAVLEVTTTGRARLIAIEPEVVRWLTERYAYYSASPIAAGVYPGQADPVPSISVLNWVVSRDDLPDAVATQLLDIIHSQSEELRQVVDIAGQINLNNLYASPIPLHEAARTWLEESRRRSGEGGS